jgi:hypothetical protein
MSTLDSPRTLLAGTEQQAYFNGCISDDNHAGPAMTISQLARTFKNGFARKPLKLSLDLARGR